MKRSILMGAATIATAALVLAGCSSDSGSDDESSSGSDSSSSESDEGGDEAVTLSLAGWSLATTPEFQLLADGFTAENPNVTIEIQDYDAANYETQITADLAAGAAPDLYTIKQLMTFPTFQEGGQLMDVSDVAGELPDDIEGLSNYEVDGATYAIPYRQDAWYLYYNKDMFDAAGVDYPDGSWTWDDYDAAAASLTEGLAAAGMTDAKGTYEHSWQSTIQGFANAQAGDAESYLSGQWEYMVPFYENALALQSAGSQEDFGVVTTNSLTYQGQFGTQKAAMMPMGSWYVATYLAQQESGDAETFNWGFAPVPQVDSSTVDEPVTFGSSTGIGINPAIDDAKVDAAKAFLAYIGSEDASVELAKIGIMPAYTTEPVAEAMFAIEGMPTDELSNFTFSTHEIGLEVPLGSDSPALNNILKDAHSAIMSGSISAADGIADAMSRAQAEVLG